MKMSIVLAAACLLFGMTGSAEAQRTGWDRFFPHVHYFKSLVADPLEPRLAIGLLQTDVFERAGAGNERPPFTFPDPDDAASDIQAAASIGGALPLWLLAEWPGKGGIVAVLQTGVFARFRMEYPTREEAATDWFIGMPIEVAYNRFEGRFRIMHRSSHIGDELVQTTGADRIEFGGEFADVLAAYRFVDAVRAYGGATFNFRSYTEGLAALRDRGRKDTGELQAGIDAEWYPWSNNHVGLVGGLDWRSTQRTNWRSTFAAAAGLGIRTPTRATQLIARYYHGPSSMGEFFLTKETFWSLEWAMNF